MNIAEAIELIIATHASPEAHTWWQTQQQKLCANFTEKDFYLAFVGAPRFVGKAIWLLSPQELTQISALKQGFAPQGWTSAQWVRTALLLELPTDDMARYDKVLKLLFETGEVSELVALYAALALLPQAERHIARATEGIRSNMAPVFEAIALHNPYPAQYLPDEAWNQLFIKAIFTEKYIAHIQDIEVRCNPALAQICRDYAHERWAAGRRVSPELWQVMSNFLDAEMWQDILHLWADDDIRQQEAAALVCMHTPYAPAREYLLAHHAQLAERITHGEIDWQRVSQKWHTTHKS